MEALFENLQNLFISGGWKLVVMWIIGGLLMVYPGTVTDLIGFAILAAIFAVQKFTTIEI